MRKAYLISLPPGAGKTRVVLKRLKKDAGGNLKVLCNNLLVLGPNKRVERVWLRELALMILTDDNSSENTIRSLSVKKLKNCLHQDGYNIQFFTFSELNKKTSIKPTAFIVIDEWHRLRVKNPELLSNMRKGKLGNYTYFVSATPLNPVMEQEREVLIGSLLDDELTIRECREHALNTISDLTDIPVDDEVLRKPFDKAIKNMGVQWLKRKTEWQPPAKGDNKMSTEPLPYELNYFCNMSGGEDTTWKSREAAWAIGLVRTNYSQSDKTFYLTSSNKGRSKKSFGYVYAQPHIVTTKKKYKAVDWLLNEHCRIGRLLKLLVDENIIKRIVGYENKYYLTKKKALIFCIHQGVARGLQLVLENVLDSDSDNEIYCAVHEDFTEVQQNGFMKKQDPPYLMITTDKLSESIDLHGDCSFLIHYELPWSPLRLLQRVGRLTRMHKDKQFRGIEIHHIIIPGSVEEERVNRLVRRTELLHNEGAWPKEFYASNKEDWLQVATALIGAGPSMHLKELTSLSLE